MRRGLDKEFDNFWIFLFSFFGFCVSTIQMFSMSTLKIDHDLLWVWDLFITERKVTLIWCKHVSTRIRDYMNFYSYIIYNSSFLLIDAHLFFPFHFRYSKKIFIVNSIDHSKKSWLKRFLNYEQDYEAYSLIIVTFVSLK